MSDAAQTFNEAYDLIEQGNLSAARQLLDDVRAENENNPDFWWLYAHAVEDPQAGQDALRRVQRLQPNYPGVNNLLQQTETSAPRPLQTLRPPQTLPDLPRTQGTGSAGDDFDDMDDDDFALDTDTGSSQNNTRRNLLIGVATVVVLLILGGLFLPSLLSGGGAQPTSTSIAQPVMTLGTLEIIDTTEDVTAAVEATATDEEIETEAVTPTENVKPTDEATVTEEDTESTKEPTAMEEETEPTEEIASTETDTEATELTSDDTFAELTGQLTDYEVPADGVEIGETLLGNTLLVTTCSAPGAAATQSILGIANVLKAETLADDVEAVGFRIVNCADDRAFRIVGVSRSDFDAFAADNITAQQLQGLLRPIG